VEGTLIVERETSPAAHREADSRNVVVSPVEIAFHLLYDERSIEETWTQMPKRVLTSAQSEKEENDSPVGSVRVLDRAMRILKHLAQQPGGLNLTKLSSEIDLHKATVLRFLRTMEQGGFVASGSDGKSWRLGPAFLDINMRMLVRHDIREIARPEMEALSARTGQTVQLALLSEGAVVYIGKVEPAELPLKINTQIGTRRPIHCTSLGKVMAAFGDQTEMERAVRASGMQRFTSQTITSLPQLREEFSGIRARGYAIDDREYNDLVACVAAPIRDASGDVIAALSVSTFVMSVGSASFRRLIPSSVDAAKRISAMVGWKESAASRGRETAHKA